MTDFIKEMQHKIDAINSVNDVSDIHRWFWNNQKEVADTAEVINRSLGLNGDTELKPDLPCLAVGALNNLVIMAANPGWGSQINEREDAYGREGIENYLDITRNYFAATPRVVGRCTMWWSRAISFIKLIPGQERYFEEANPFNGRDRWSKVHTDGLIGGWELFPWHSSSDGLTHRVNDLPWLRNFYDSSINAILRIKPRILFVVSKTGHDLIRDVLKSDLRWKDFEIGNARHYKGSYTRSDNGAEIITFRGQLFSNLPRDFTNADMIQKISEIRTAY